GCAVARIVVHHHAFPRDGGPAVARARRRIERTQAAEDVVLGLVRDDDDRQVHARVRVRGGGRPRGAWRARAVPDSKKRGAADQGSTHARHPSKKKTNDATLIEPLPTSLSGPDFKSALVRREDCRRRLRFVQPKIRHHAVFSAPVVADSKPWVLRSLQHPARAPFQSARAIAVAKMLPMLQFTSARRWPPCRLLRHSV